MGDSDWRPFIYGGLASIVAEFGEMESIFPNRPPDPPDSEMPVVSTATKRHCNDEEPPGPCKKLIVNSETASASIQMVYTHPSIVVDGIRSYKATDSGPFIVHVSIMESDQTPGTFPIDTTKTRLQIQGQKIDPRHVELRYTGMVDCFVKTSKQEGVKALYCGIWPAVLRQATYGTIKFGTYYSLKEALAQHRVDRGTKEHLPTNTFCAAFAGGLSSAIANPTDVLKVRMQMGNEKRNLVRCFVEIYRVEGVSGLWRGVGPTSQRAAVIAAVELPVYDASKRHLLPALGDSPANHFASSLLASLGSAVASTPLDVIRTRMMNQRKIKDHIAKPSEKIYTGTIDCFLRTVRSEGLMALYKGFIPTWVRMGPWNIIFFLTYEQLKHFY